MDQIKVEQYIRTNHHFFEPEDIPALMQYLLRADETNWSRAISTELQDPNTVRVVSIFAGPIGIDRFMIGDVGLGILKTITCGGLGIWAILDCFLVYRSARKNNFKKLISTF